MISPLGARVWRAAAVTCVTLGVATVVACKGGGGAPEIDPIDKQVVQVGVQLSLTLDATDPDGDPLDFDFDSTIPDVQTRAQLTRSPSGAAIWRWTPLAADVGTWFVDFAVTDGDNETTTTVEIEVKPAVGDAGAPVFRKPLGTGTTLDLTAAQCLDVDVVVEDQDSTSVVLSQEAPQIEGATLDVAGGLTGTWHWCPTREQIIAEDRYTLTLGADDLTNPKTLKNYLVVLRSGDGSQCPGDAPVIDHTPADVTSINNLTIDARVTDDLGLKQPPLLYYAETDPGATPDLGAMVQVSTLLIDGSMQDGTWAADVPNPVASAPAGTSRTLYYVLVADDDDDATGDCDHVTTSPVYSMTITAGGGGTAGLCEACTADAQCGGGGNLCVRVGVMNEPYCLAACTPGSCPSGYTCSTTAVTSVDGASGRQCVPDAGSCTGSTSCADDLYEENDDRTQAHAQGALPPNDIFELTSCPLVTGGGDDEDFFELAVTEESQVTIEITGGTQTDLDLALQSQAGAVLQSSTSLTSDERISRCLSPGTYYARVYSWGTVKNDYLLSYDRVAQSCANACNEDTGEDDDTAVDARLTTFPLYTSSAQTICSDDDWYALDLVAGDRVVVDLTFTQGNAQQDLDLHFVDSAGTDLTPCTEPNGTTCTVANGQSADSNEHTERTIATSGVYYVVVHGWAGSKNTYDIRIAVQ